MCSSPLALRKALTSERVNESTIDKETLEAELIMYIGTEKQKGLIKELLYGSNGFGGLNKTIKDTIRRSNDYCIVCTQKVNKATMHF